MSRSTLATPTIVLAGGGTLGPVTPLLALASAVRARGLRVAWVGTVAGPEAAVVHQAGIAYHGITAPKLHRYVTWRHLLIPVELVAGLYQSWRLLRRLRPAAVVSAAGYVAVPVSIIAAMLGIPICIHQQDLQLSLTNRLLQWLAELITVSFRESLQQFRRSAHYRLAWIGSPVRDLTPTTHEFTLDPDYPTVFIFGGGTGAQGINELVTAELARAANVIHVTGRGRLGTMPVINHPRYVRRELLTDSMAEALAAADLVVCRAGIGTIAELAALGKPALIIPMPDSHQEVNADWLAGLQAAVVRPQNSLTPESFCALIQKLLADGVRLQHLSQQITRLHKPNAARVWAELVRDCMLK